MIAYIWGLIKFKSRKTSHLIPIQNLNVCLLLKIHFLQYILVKGIKKGFSLEPTIELMRQRKSFSYFKCES